MIDPIEKPAPLQAQSTLRIIGCYILLPEFFYEFARRGKGAGAEIQLTDAVARLIGRIHFRAVRTTCTRYNRGDKVGVLRANIALGVARPGISDQLQARLAATPESENTMSNPGGRASIRRSIRRPPSMRS